MSAFGFWPVAVQPLGSITSATSLWRLEGRLHVTVVVKATFSFRQGSMALVEPAPICPEEGELAPYLARADVVLEGGHACACPPRPVSVVATRLAVMGDTLLLDKRLLVYPHDEGVARAPLVDDGPTPAASVVNPSAPERSVPYGVMPPEAPLRRELLAGDPLGDGQLVLEIPSGFAWEYFQVAAPDQRCAYLVGDEWIMLDGMHPHESRVQSQLPGARAEVRVYPPSARVGGGPQFQVAMLADRLSIDADAQQCALLWRGSFPVADVDSARALTLVSAVSLPDEPSAWAEAGEPIEAPLAMSTRLSSAASSGVAVWRPESTPEPPLESSPFTCAAESAEAADMFDMETTVPREAEDDDDEETVPRIGGEPLVVPEELMQTAVRPDGAVPDSAAASAAPSPAAGAEAVDSGAAEREAELALSDDGCVSVRFRSHEELRAAMETAAEASEGGPPEQETPGVHGGQGPAAPAASGADPEFDSQWLRPLPLPGAPWCEPPASEAGRADAGASGAAEPADLPVASVGELEEALTQTLSDKEADEVRSIVAQFGSSSIIAAADLLVDAAAQAAGARRANQDGAPGGEPGSDDES